ncbi:hypothetical protein [Tautonia marina]|uniref:hypothetical protein n=1 Tax=Tautonia marina TaxID=2653855 RepID=UPI001260FD0C|nr:hypothetical protein [Tautonia marina]
MIRSFPQRRSWPLLLIGIGLCLSLVTSDSQAQEEAPPVDDAPATPIELRPYTIRVWFSIDSNARMGQASAEALIDQWLTLTHRFVGAPWQIEIQPDEGPLRGRSPQQLEPALVAPGVKGAEKGWFLRVESAPTGGGFTLLGREYDATARQLGPLYRQPAPYPKDAARALFELSRRVFSPVAEIVRSDPGAELRVQGAALPTPDRLGRLVEPGLVFRPYWIFLGPESTIREIRSIPFTYLHVDEIEGSIARCEIVSGLRQPLPKQVAGRYRLVALGLNPADVPTRFRFVSGEGEQQLPAAGYVLTARGLRDRVASEVGTTDREGRITLPPRFSDKLVMLRLLAAGIEPLREFPVLPGESPEEREVPVEPRPEAVSLEFRLKALQDEIVDLIARRGVLEARLDARASGQAWDEVKQLLEEYDQFPARSEFEERLARLAEDAQLAQAELGVPILTRTAQAELAETRALIERYLDDEAYQAYLDAYQRAQDPDGTSSSLGSPSPLVRSTEGSPVRSPDSPKSNTPASKPSANPAQPKPATPQPRAPSGGGGLVPF